MRRELISLCTLCLLWSAGRADENAILKRDVETMRRQLQQMEAEHQALKAELDEARAALVQSKLQADAFEHRCKKLQDDLNLFRSGRFGDIQPAINAPRGDLAIRRKPANEPVHGKVTGIGKDGRLLQISLGFEHGVKDGQTLEVYRLPGKGSLKPIYLGTLTINRVDPQTALGQFSAVEGVNYRPAIGDDVASEFIIK